MNKSKPQKVVDRILGHVRNAGSLVVCVGAEVSMAAGVPTWSEIARDYYFTHMAESDPLLSKGEYADFIKKASPAEIANMITVNFGKEELVRQLQKAIADSNARPTQLHFALAELPAKMFITSNYDLLLEEALSVRNREHNVVARHKDIQYLTNDVLSVVKLHGSIDSPVTVVLSEEAYTSFPFSNREVDASLRTLFAISLVLFVGYSVDNRVFQNLYYRYKGSETGPSGWIVFTHRYSSLEYKLWKDRGVLLVRVPFKDLPEILSTLGHRMAPLTHERVSYGKKNQIFVSASSSDRSVIKELRSALPKELNLVSLEDTPSSGETLWEKFERIVTDSRAAIVVLGSEERNLRGAPGIKTNAAFELGYLIATVGRENVLVIVSPDLELPSDLAGMSYVVAHKDQPEKFKSYVNRWISRAVKT